MTQLRALLFDVDGTLAETERDGHRVAFNRAFAHFGLPWQWSESEYGDLLRIAGGKERIEHYASQSHPEWLKGPGSRDLIAGVHGRKNQVYLELLAAGKIRLRRGLMAFLSDARAARLRLGIVTTTSRCNVEGLLASTLDERGRAAFAVRVAGENVGRKKPDPQCYRLALEALDLRPGEALAIEDSPGGLAAARAAGLEVLVVRSAYFKNDAFDDALAVIDDFEGLSVVDLAQMHSKRVAGRPHGARGRLAKMQLNISRSSR
jgi:HAD superfamily hydrolase (TIGR01509 family)